MFRQAPKSTTHPAPTSSGPSAVSPDLRLLRSPVPNAKAHAGEAPKLEQPKSRGRSAAAIGYLYGLSGMGRATCGWPGLSVLTKPRRATSNSPCHRPVQTICRLTRWQEFERLAVCRGFVSTLSPGQPQVARPGTLHLLTNEAIYLFGIATPVRWRIGKPPSSHSCTLKKRCVPGASPLLRLTESQLNNPQYAWTALQTNKIYSFDFFC